MFKYKLFVLVLYLLLSLPSGVLAQTAVYNIFAAVGANGTLDISTASPTLTTVGSSASFKFNADNGYHIASITVCGGSDYANINSTMTSYVYTTGPIQAQCTVSAVFSNSNSVIQLPQTGQTKCYDTAGAEITCAGTGQDGDKLAGAALPNPRFIDNSNGTVTDNLTGLIWLKNAACVSWAQTSQQSLDSVKNVANGICSLTDNSVAGDWRLPNKNELESIFAAAGIAGGGNFITHGNGYRSSTSCANDPTNEWNIWDVDGSSGCGSKMGYTGTWPVRGNANAIITLPKTGQTLCYSAGGVAINCEGTGQDAEFKNGINWPSPRFVNNSNGTITDNITGLVWMKNANCFNLQDWSTALTLANTLASGSCGLTNGSTAGQWRLPNRKEMLSLANYQQSDGSAWLQLQEFTNVKNNFYWTADTNTYNMTPLIGSIQGGIESTMFNSDTNYILAVREQFPIISLSLPIKNFGNVTVNSTSTGQMFTISNNGTSSLIVSTIVSTGADSGMFTLTVGDGTGGDLRGVTYHRSGWKLHGFRNIYPDFYRRKNNHPADNIQRSGQSDQRYCPLRHRCTANLHNRHLGCRRQRYNNL